MEVEGGTDPFPYNSKKEKPEPFISIKENSSSRGWEVKGGRRVCEKVSWRCNSFGSKRGGERGGEGVLIQLKKKKKLSSFY